MEGPAFSTRAQSLMHRLWGGDLIGMTAMPEAKLAREAEISYALLALVTDYDCWKTPPKPPGGEAKAPEAPGADAQALLREILGNLEAASANALRLIERAIQLSAAREEQLLTSPAQSALKLAIWSDKSRIEPGEVQRLGPLWMKHF
jgi:5'-methylthioadenosine phosphorylase